MNDTVYLMDLFSACPLSEDRRAVFQQAKVLGADIDPEARRVEVRLFAPTYLSGAQLKALRDDIQASYGLEGLAFRCTFPETALPEADHRDFVDLLCSVYPPARAILAGSRWEMTAEAVTINLVANGKEQLEPYLPELSRHFQIRSARRRRSPSPATAPSPGMPSIPRRRASARRPSAHCPRCRFQ